MLDSTSELQIRPEISLVDVVKKRLEPPSNEYIVQNWLRHFMEISDSWDTHRSYENIEIADLQHAENRALLRWLGRTESNATAAPEVRQLSNHYPDEFSALEGRVRGFLSYGKNWDGEDAKEIPQAAVYSSLNFLAELRGHFSGLEPRSAAPSPDGEIVLYWHNPTGYAEINFDGSGKLSMCWSIGDEELRSIEENVESGAEHDASRVWDILKEFLGKFQEEETVQEVL